MELLVNGQPVNEIESTICQIEGIQAARIVTDPEGISEVHVLSDPARNLKQLARDIESAIMAKHGLAIDHRKISIAQVSDNGETIEPLPRPRLKSVNVETAGIHAKVTVALEFSGKDCEGVSQGVASSSSKLRLIGEATLDAIEKMDKVPGGLALEDVSLVSLGPRKVATVCINLLTLEKELVFSGSCLATNNENEAIVKAVLSALNRRFGFV